MGISGLDWWIIHNRAWEILEEMSKVFQGWHLAKDKEITEMMPNKVNIQKLILLIFASDEYLEDNFL